MAYIVDNVSGTGGGGSSQATVLYVDSVNGDDGNVGSFNSPKKTIKSAVASANAGYLVQVAAGVYAETLPIDITVENLSIVGVSQRSCFVHPTTVTQYNTMFRCNSGTYIDGFTFAGLKASGVRGEQPINGVNPDTDPTYGLPPNQGWVAGFLPGCIVRKSPYVNNCTNFADSAIDNDNFDPNNYAGTGGDTNSAASGGGIIVDGSLPDLNSPLRSFVVNEFTQICLDGPGLLVCNNGYAQAVSFFGLFCHYHAKALSGGQINMEVGTTDFGRYGLIADGKSPSAIFTALSTGTASTGNTTFVIAAPNYVNPTWFGDKTRPSLNMLVQIGSNIYPILSGTANGTGWTVQISNPNPLDYSQNLGLITGFGAGTTVSFYLRSMVSTASHTMEYAGSGCDYNALPENGGVPDETKEVTNLRNGKVWLTSTDQSGKFKVGTTFAVDQQTGSVQIAPAGLVVASNVSSDPNPALGGDLDLRNHKIYTSYGNTDITIEANGTGGVVFGNAIRAANGTAALPSISFTSDVNTGIYRVRAETIGFTTNGTAKATIDDTAAPIKEVYSSVFYPIVTQVDIGTDPNQVPLNGYLGTMAFQDSDGVSIGTATVGTLTVTSADTTIFGVRVGRGGGAQALNTAVGISALNANTTGAANTAIGAQSLISNTTGSNNITVGDQCLAANTTGNTNIAIGSRCLISNSTGGNNVGLGTLVLNANTTGANNFGAGYQALYLNTGSSNIALGFQAGYYLTTGSNNTIIGSIQGTAGLSDTVIIGAGSTERLRIDSSGRLLVGTSTAPTGSLSANSFFHVRGNTASSSGGGQLNLSSNQTSAGLNGWAGAYHLGRFIFTDTQAGEYAYITCTVDTNNAGVGSYPGRLVFSITADGAASPTERMRIDSAGRVLVGTTTANTSGAKLQTSDGLTFPSSQISSADPNTLDDYEEGTFTPSYKADTTNPTLGYGSINRGKYTKIGRIVHVQIMLQSTAVSVTGSGSLFVGDLPFSPQVDDFGGYGTFSIGWNTAFNLATGERIGAIIDGNSGKLRIIAQNDDTASYTTLAAGALSSISGGAYFLLAGSYLVA
jgi:hypothetical protein